MRVAIVHYWLVGMRGGEKVVEALCRLFPQADIFTHVYVPDCMSETIRQHRVSTSFIARLPAAARRYRSYLPLMPMALEQLDLRGYDLIISSESGPAKGIIPAADAVHVCYCHSPMRYVWNMYHDYREGTGLLTRMLMPPIFHYIRNWDSISASRVHHFIANSATVERRLMTYYGRTSEVIHPPVDTDAFAPAPKAELGEFYLTVGELVPYKRTDLAIDAFRRNGRNLVVVGGGPDLAKLKAAAPPNVTVLGPQPFERLRYLYARCKALVFPGEEDFGIVPVEAMASGRPVIAYGKGGTTETVIAGKTGVFFREQTADAITAAVEELDRQDLNPREIADHARQFDSAVFLRRMQASIEAKIGRAAEAPPMRQAAPSLEPAA